MTARPSPTSFALAEAYVAFVARARADARRPGGWTPVVDRPDGYSVSGRPYVAVRCHCPAAGCPGFVMVHDDPHARAYFEKLFGAPAQREARP